MKSLGAILCVFNGNLFLKEVIESTLPHVDKLIIVEGSWGRRFKSVRSNDGTIETIAKYVDEDKDDKIIPISYLPINYNESDDKARKKWLDYCGIPPYALDEILNNVASNPFYDKEVLYNQICARNVGLRALDTDWFMIVDCDEIYKPYMWDNIHQFIESNPCADAFAVQAYVFYFDFWHCAKERYTRLFRCLPNMYFTHDNSLRYKESIPYRQANIPNDVAHMYHYGYVGTERVKTKINMWQQDIAEGWYAMKYEPIVEYKEENDTEELMDIHLLGEVHPGYQNYRLFDFIGEHPNIMKSHKEHNTRVFSKIGGEAIG
jgi:hypothetical protein